jgi:hypothetical protein
MDGAQFALSRVGTTGAGLKPMTGCTDVNDCLERIRTSPEKRPPEFEGPLILGQCRSKSLPASGVNTFPQANPGLKATPSSGFRRAKVRA